MKIVAICLIALTGVAAHAEPYSPLPAMTTGLDETPSMKQAKYERAVALRAEATALLEQDNGTLTPAHAAYIRQKACEIVGSKPTGRGIVSRNRCRM
ncbi:hypothetical protein HL653_09610 [Sphingomonas sp. AP4-R1]|uniref:hypothetical protein n=1 Tax=Sphingomonas sp. AP4-R1 TaxID=2735134 RepID=UPI0014935B1C|nr:hypothetical protein [Sphingomonas sp. AP4-R1]QJU58019.1 hypothetical protein HL653_09610 [Sphingomonas sp. AP4-R1]